MDLLLLTGATGFLGGAVLDKLMNNQKNIELITCGYESSWGKNME